MNRAATIAVFAWLAAACAAPELKERCTVDADCPAAFACDAVSGQCHCASDAACAQDEFCNGLNCQRRIGCDTSFDCPEGTWCEARSGRCVDRDRCTEDVQCAIGQVCDGVRFQCVNGCRDAGDCRLGQVCRCEGEESCPVGICEGNRCDDDTYCRYGERCVPGDDGDKHCVVDERGPFCEGCQLQPGGLSRCPGDEPNFCLLDRKVTYRRTYCGVDCSQDQPCPYGYACRNILILTKALCQADTDCAPSGPPCAVDADCAGARCDVAAGRCAGRCSFNEDSKSGFCTCSADSECPQDTCLTTTGRCAITRRPCTTDGDECDRAIYCVNLGNRAACLIGRNCTPVDGLTCDDVRGEPTQ